jgi:hypothetical protein
MAARAILESPDSRSIAGTLEIIGCYGISTAIAVARTTAMPALASLGLSLAPAASGQRTPAQ